MQPTRRDSPSETRQHRADNTVRQRQLDLSGDRGMGLASYAMMPRYAPVVARDTASDEPPAEEKSEMSSLRILVADDDTVIGMLLAQMLEGMGYDVCAVEKNEADAVTGAIRHKPDLMIVDVRLGGGSGLAAIDQVLTLGYVPHMFVSGDIAEVQAQRPHATVMRKPFREWDLVRAIRRALHAPQTH